MKAFFPGSFNPFTIGHLDILARALAAFGNVVVAIGYNENKKDASIDANAAMLRRLLEGCPGVTVMTYSGLTVDAARREGAGVIVRGFRNAIDAEYERQLADTNRMISRDESRSPVEIETWLIPARPELGCVSSSMVRELSHNGHPIDRYLPGIALCRRLCAEAIATYRG
ncbi:MAG: pantetheine-phosphate adenylyltransferase [Muribaculaceae bacterium]|nr:pantetheine-phosphate adenylyltransferase [Muribaculaceae bacterium]